MSKPSLSEKQSQESAELKLLNLNAAGLDIGAEEIYACVPSDRDERPIRSFGTYTAELKMLADRLASVPRRDSGHGGIDRSLLGSESTKYWKSEASLSHWRMHVT